MLVNQNAVGFATGTSSSVVPNNIQFLAYRPIFLPSPQPLFINRGGNREVNVITRNRTNYGTATLPLYFTFDTAGFFIKQFASNISSTDTIGEYKVESSNSLNNPVFDANNDNNYITGEMTMFYVLGNKKFKANAFTRSITIRIKDNMVVMDVELFYYNSREDTFTLTADDIGIKDLVSSKAMQLDGSSIFPSQMSLHDFTLTISTNAEPQQKMDNTYGLDGGSMSISLDTKGSIDTTTTLYNKNLDTPHSQTMTFDFYFPVDHMVGSKERISLSSNFVLQDFDFRGQFDENMIAYASYISSTSSLIMKRYTRGSGSTPVTPTFIPSPYNMVPMVV